MNKRILFVGIMCLAFALSIILLQPAGAQENKGAASGVPTAGVPSQKTFGTVGDVKYVDFKGKGDPTIVVKNNKGEEIKVSFKDVRADAKILVTYRQEKDEKGNERNVLISLSVIRPVAEPQQQKKGK